MLKYVKHSEDTEIKAGLKNCFPCRMRHQTITQITLLKKIYTHFPQTTTKYLRTRRIKTLLLPGGKGSERRGHSITL